MSQHLAQAPEVYFLILVASLFVTRVEAKSIDFIAKVYLRNACILSATAAAITPEKATPFSTSTFFLGPFVGVPVSLFSARAAAPLASLRHEL